MISKIGWKVYYLGRLSMVSVTRQIIIRTDWLKKLNLEVPKTTEELYKVAKAFAEMDPDGNGKKDTYGWRSAVSPRIRSIKYFRLLPIG